MTLNYKFGSDASVDDFVKSLIKEDRLFNMETDGGEAYRDDISDEDLCPDCDQAKYEEIDYPCDECVHKHLWGKGKLSITKKIKNNETKFKVSIGLHKMRGEIEDDIPLYDNSAYSLMIQELYNTLYTHDQTLKILALSKYYNNQFKQAISEWL